MLEEPAECAGEPRQIGIARGTRAGRAREALLDPAQNLEVGAMLVVEHVADLPLEAHCGSPSIADRTRH